MTTPLFLFFYQMNLTISCFFRRHFSNSPFLTRSNRFLQTDTIIRNCYFRRFTKPIFFSISNKNKLQAQNTKFSEIYNNAITLSTKQAKSSTISHRNVIKETSKINNCVFTKCRSAAINGSAIYSEYNVSLYNCLFSRCMSSFGAVYCTKSASFIYCSFFDNEGKSQSSSIAVRPTSTDDVINSIDYCAFKNNKADLFGSIYRDANGTMTMKRTNFTKSCSTCVGAAEFGHGSCTLKYVFFSRCSATAHNGCLVLRSTISTDVRNCVFLENQHKSTESIAGAALLAYINPEQSYLTDSYFINNSKHKSYTLRVYFGNPMFITDTCFTGNFSQEFLSDPDDSILQGITDFSTCRANATFNIDIGYMKERKLSEEVDIMTCIVLYLTTIAVLFALNGITRRAQHTRKLRERKPL